MQDSNECIRKQCSALASLASWYQALDDGLISLQTMAIHTYVQSTVLII
jgi:hypothetical protein